VERRAAVSCPQVPPGPKVLRVGTLTAIGTLDPHRAHDFSGHLVVSQVFESPYALVDGRPEPRLVVATPVRRDTQSFQVELRSGLCFSDGSRVTPDDVAASIRPALSAWGIDVSVTTNGVLLQSRAWRHPPEEVLATVGTKLVKRTPSAVLGTGPFMVAEASSKGIRLVRNPHALRRANVDEITIRWYEFDDGRPDALVAAIAAGEVDFTMSLARDDVGGLQRVRKLFQPGMSTAFLAFNTTQPHLATPTARRALAMAIDRYRLAELCYANPAAFVARCVLPPALGRGNDGIRHDPASAEAALAALGPPDRMRMICVWGPRPYLSRPEPVAARIAQQLRSIGIQLDTQAAKDSEHYGALLARGDYDLVLGGWVADTPDPLDYLDALLGSGAFVGSGSVPIASSNYSRWRDAEMDRLLADARGGGGGPEIIDDILARVASEVPLMPLMHGPRVIVHAWRMKGYDPDASMLPDFAVVDLDE
jgi:ABC-type transport system substrate-binding protein